VNVLHETQTSEHNEQVQLQTKQINTFFTSVISNHKTLINVMLHFIGTLNSCLP